jgi:hypothetical protein
MKQLIIHSTPFLNLFLHAVLRVRMIQILNHVPSQVSDHISHASGIVVHAASNLLIIFPSGSQYPHFHFRVNYLACAKIHEEIQCTMNSFLDDPTDDRYGSHRLRVDCLKLLFELSAFGTREQSESELDNPIIRGQIGDRKWEIVNHSEKGKVKHQVFNEMNHDSRD